MKPRAIDSARYKRSGHLTRLRTSLMFKAERIVAARHPQPNLSLEDLKPTHAPNRP